ncbi:MAG: UDP-N-acetylmuramoyl-L-alanine--D-glutamate ligase [Holosporaceae bacterium]|jgi:UDP-N-acetylmuramoylalanine--D-glutamate ligase|nr:UDP-N-acetylmuramoyl-L-alanine--D-glutamate ligase [Holosporaceae bacterium]
MIVSNLYKGGRVAVIGFGKTGRSVADSLAAGGAEVLLYDDSEICDENYRRFLGGNFIDEKPDAVVVSPGINLMWPKPHPLVKEAARMRIPILNDLDLFRLHVTGKINVCITGTNGKSTTTALIHHLLNFAGRRAEIGGNFGAPILSVAADADFFVAELSSYQLESCNIFGFDVGVLLNITPDHLTRHGGIEGYIAAKQRIFADFGEKSVAVIGADCDYCLRIREFLERAGHPRVIPISGRFVPEFGVGWEKNRLTDDREGLRRIVCESNPRLDGDHNRQNIAAAYAACFACLGNDLADESFRGGLFSFRGLEHRQEIASEINGVLYVNDSKATNADSAEEALKRFGSIIWISGGRPKEDGMGNLPKYFDKIKSAFLIGEAAEEWSALLTQRGVKNEISETLERATARARETAIAGDVVLLSPACASFDQFKDFEDRGRQFKNLVFRLKEKTK